MKNENRCVVVTGGASGVGAAICRRFANENYKVIIADLDLAKARALSDELNNEGFRTFAVHVDVADGGSYEGMILGAIDRFGVPDVIVNNAGVSQQYVKAHEVALEDYDRQFNVNVRPIYWCAKYAIPQMIENGGGVVVNTCSVSAVRPRPLFTWYAASKAATVMATKALAIEYAGENVRVCGVNPGPVGTPLLTAALMSFGGEDEQRVALEKMQDGIPLKRIAVPEDIANAVYFLASDEASFVTGTVMDVDGGRAI